MDYSKIPFSQFLGYVALGVLLLVVFYLINNYIIPISKGRQPIVKKYWQKIQIIAWLSFFGLFFVAMFRVNMYITLVFLAVITGLGWNYWQNIFSGIIIKFNNQLKVGDAIATDFATGELKKIGLSQSELVNNLGELVVIPNFKLKSSVLKHLYKKSNIQTHSFTVEAGSRTTDDIYQMALSCPFISANQKIDVQRLNKQEVVVKASVLDNVFVDRVNAYFG